MTNNCILLLVVLIWCLIFLSSSLIYISNSLIHHNPHTSKKVFNNITTKRDNVGTSSTTTSSSSFRMMKSSINKVAAVVSASTASSSSVAAAAGADIITRKVKPLPYIVYGTAWKKERTKSLVVQAITAGFRAIDTACQPKHYNEPGVGEALQAVYNDGIVTRQDIFLQTKFTSLGGQDPHTVPYDPTAALREQVLQSFSISCKNLHTDYVDSLVLHSPMQSYEETLVVWKAMEEIYNDGGALHLGISNTYDIKLLTRLYDDAAVKPQILQNRFYVRSNYDVEIRKFCSDNAIRYQSFWTLTANPHVTDSSLLRSLATKYSKTPQQVFFKFVQSLGITPLTGTTSPIHMTEDLATLDFVIDSEDVNAISKFMKI